MPAYGKKFADNRYAFQVLYFSGLPPSTMFGKLWVSTGISVYTSSKAIGLMGTCIVRGGYPATHSAIHQLRKLGIPL